MAHNLVTTTRKLIIRNSKIFLWRACAAQMGAERKPVLLHLIDQ